jgi:hypothetical protein
MKVKELIDRLNKLDPEAMVVRSGYEGGVAEINGVGTCTIALNVHDEWYYGPHDFIAMESDYPDAVRIQTVFVS